MCTKSGLSEGHEATGARWPVLVYGIVASVALMFVASAPSPFYPRLAAELGLSPVGMVSLFAVYVGTMLVALLAARSLSDRVGRRPVIVTGGVVLAVSLVMFAFAGDYSQLVAARALQGVAAGILAPALSALIVDASGRAAVAAAWNTVAPMTGLGLGALTAALVADTRDDAFPLVFGAAAALWLVVAVVAGLLPSKQQVPGPRMNTSSAVAQPRIVLPVSVVLTLCAGWATNGVFLALVTSVVRDVFGFAASVNGGAVIAMFAASGIVTAIALRSRSARTISIYATSALSIGTAASMLGILAASAPLYLVAVVTVGSGFGTAFMGALGTLMPITPLGQEARMMGIVYVVSYLAFSLPSVVTGLLVPMVGLQTAMVVQGAAVLVASVLATLTRLRLRAEPVEQRESPRAYGRRPASDAARVSR